MSGEHSHPELASKQELAAVATASAADVAALSIEVAVLAERVAVLEGGEPSPPVEPEPGPDPKPGGRARATLGVYPGFGNPTGLAKLDYIEGLLGRELPYVDANLDDKTWSTLSASSWMFASTDGWKTRSDVTVCLTVPLRTREDAPPIARDLLDIANGSHDSTYKTIADRLIGGGHGNATLRIGHEGDIGLPGSSGYPWSFTREGSHAEYIAAWRHVAEYFTARSAEFRCDYQGNGPWNLINPATGTPCGDSAYPGDDVVDIIGVDVYDRRPWDSAQVVEKLDYCRDLAVRHKKPMSVPEWGLWIPERGDNPAFIHHMADWLDTAPSSGPGAVAYHCYFWGISESNLDAAPKSKAAFIERFS